MSRVTTSATMFDDCVQVTSQLAERLRGRTVINLYQTEGAADDLLSDHGVI